HSDSWPLPGPRVPCLTRNAPWEYGVGPELPLVRHAKSTAWVLGFSQWGAAPPAVDRDAA
ncbi:MAG: hypothetical protein WD358_03610, partial [Nitriliruptoraceae bacterium]